jgi:hypothetical protein
MGRRHITTLMRCMGITALAPQPGTSKRPPGHKVYPHLLRNVTIERANQVWSLDTTYIPMTRGLVCLTAVVRRGRPQRIGALDGRDAGGNTRSGSDRTSPCPLRHSRDPQNQPRQPVHHRGRCWLGAGNRLPAADGLARCLARQRLHRAAVAQRQIRARVPEGLQQREHRAHRHLPVSGLLQRCALPFQSRPTRARRKVLRPFAATEAGRVR